MIWILFEKALFVIVIATGMVILAPLMGIDWFFLPKEQAWNPEPGFSPEEIEKRNEARWASYVAA